MKILLESANNSLLELLVRAATDEKLRTQCLKRALSDAWQLQYLESLQSSEKPALIPEDSAPAFLRCALVILSDRKHTNRKCKEAAKKYVHILAGHPYFNFYALKKLADHSTKMLMRDKENAKGDPVIHINKACAFAQTAADNHPTLGYLLHAFVNFKIAQFLQNRNVALATAHTETAFKHLLIAQELEPYSHKEMNASTHWGFESVGAMKSALEGFIKESGLLVITTRAISSAAETARSIIEFRYPEFEDGEERFALKHF